jgi:hypothetical protein
LRGTKRKRPRRLRKLWKRLLLKLDRLLLRRRLGRGGRRNARNVRLYVKLLRKSGRVKRKRNGNVYKRNVNVKLNVSGSERRKRKS